MTIDEDTLREFCQHALTGVTVRPDIVMHARRRGARRLHRRMTLIGAAGVAVLATFGLSVGIASTRHSQGASITSLAIPSADASPADTPSEASPRDEATYPPPTAASCNVGTSRRLTAADAPELLLLPEGVTDSQTLLMDMLPACRDAHTALFAAAMRGPTIVATLLVEGPDAPSARQLGFDGGGVGCIRCSVTHPRVRGATGEVHATPNSVDVWWTEPDGGQWHALASGTSGDDTPGAAALATATVGELDRATITGNSMTVSDKDAPAAAGWVQLHPVGSPPGDQLSAETTWLADGIDYRVEVEPAATPESTSGLSARLLGRAANPDERQLVTVDGHAGIYEDTPAALATQTETGSSLLEWQQGDVTVLLAGENRRVSVEQLQQIAASLRLVSPDDPRLPHP